MHKTVNDDIDLVRSVLRGDQSAFQQLVERYQDFVFTICVRVLKSREEAEEIAQDVFIKVYATLGSFEQRSKFSSWLYTVAYRTALDRARRRKLAITSIDSDDSFLQLMDDISAGPEKQLQQRELQQQLQWAIHQLPAQDATIITLFYLQEKSVQEIANICGLTGSNVKTKLFRLRERLRKILSKRLQTEFKDLF